MQQDQGAQNAQGTSHSTLSWLCRASEAERSNLIPCPGEAALAGLSLAQQGQSLTVVQAEEWESFTPFPSGMLAASGQNKS